MSDQFSIDTYHEILKRLPVRSLGRCCCVSKTWKSHIQSRQFIAAHLATPSAGGDGPILWATTAEYSCRRLSKPSVLLEQEEKGEREERDRERGSGSDSSESESELEIERRPRGMLQLEGSLKQKYVLLESESESETYYRSSMEFQFPFNFPNYLRRPVEILGCVNGVLLLTVVTEYEGHLYHTMLWNPMVCRWLFLPQPQIRPKRHLCLSGLESLGFGYDPSEDDFRVVRLLYVRPSRWTPGDADSWKHTDFCTYDGDGDGDYQLEWDERGTRCPPQVVHDWADWRGWPVYPGYDYRYPPKVEVCYVKERIWRRVNYAAAAAADDDDQVLSSCFAGMLPKHQCYMNASVHWVARAYNKSNDNNYSTQLLVFNFESERFHSIKLPDQLAHLTPHLGQIASVAAFRGSLLISECTRKRGGISVRCSLWWLTDYSDATSWAKLVTVPLPTSLDWVLWLGSTQSDGDDDAVLVSDRRGQLMLYDPVCAMYRVLGFNPSGELGLLSIPYACPFKESLYLLDLDQDHHP